MPEKSDDFMLDLAELLEVHEMTIGDFLTHVVGFTDWENRDEAGPFVHTMAGIFLARSKG